MLKRSTSSGVLEEVEEEEGELGFERLTLHQQIHRIIWKKDAVSKLYVSLLSPSFAEVGGTAKDLS